MNTQLTPAGLSLKEEGRRSYFEKPSNVGSYFIVRTANEWMELAKTKPLPRRLFGNLWFEGEICILFADTNVGKSILAVQIADQISRGKSYAFTREQDITAKAVTLTTECDSQKVVYFDFELSTKQFAMRFCEKDESASCTNYYEFHPNFYRGAINENHFLTFTFRTYHEFLFHELERAIVSSGAKVFVVDNITYLADETETAAFALPLMKTLKRLKAKHGLSFLIVAHTPKRDQWMPITRNDLMGSKMLVNFCDSSFAIGESNRVQGLRYIKQIKARNTEIEYSAENVLLAKLMKPSNQLYFEFLETAVESDHIKFQRDWQRQEHLPEVIRLHAEGLSTRKIGAKLGISAMSVSRYLKTVTVEESD